MASQRPIDDATTKDVSSDDSKLDKKLKMNDGESTDAASSDDNAVSAKGE